MRHTVKALIKRATYAVVSMAAVATCTISIRAAEPQTLSPAAPATTDTEPFAQLCACSITAHALTSKAGLEYRIFISAPRAAAPPGGFPVIYVADGNAHTSLIADIVRYHEGLMGPAVVVGIGYPTEAMSDARRRAYDFTPPGAILHPEPEAAPFKTGGADLFLDFIESSVKPFVRSQLQIDPTRQALFGHSLGGLFVVHAMFVKPDAFGTFVAASPSIFWNDRAVLAGEQAFESAIGAHKSVRVLITVGELESSINEPRMRRLGLAHPDMLRGKSIPDWLARLRKDVVAARMIENARELAERLAAKGLDARFVVFPGEDHNSEVVDAFNRGVPFALGPFF